MPVYLVDPGINGTHTNRARWIAGDQVRRAESDVDVLHHQGNSESAVALGTGAAGRDDCGRARDGGIPSLAFAVGVYLPLSSSSPIFIGGMIRWLVDKYLRKKLKSKKLTEEEFVAETDKSPGVLMASGYIAGGALAAVFHRFLCRALERAK